MRYRSTILNLGTRWKRDQPKAPLVLPLGKSPQYPLYRRLGEPQNLSERCEEEKNLLTLRGTEYRPFSL
jgi:hypothetical protein